MHQDPIPGVRAADDHFTSVSGVDPPNRKSSTLPMPDEENGAIVVVDDDDGVRQAFERVLNAAGYQAVTFASAETLLESDAADSAACLVLDVHLPGLSGFELRRELVRIGARQPPVIFITGHDEPAARDQAEALGAAAYLPKPFAGRMLVEAVARAVREAART